MEISDSFHAGSCVGMELSFTFSRLLTTSVCFCPSPHCVGGADRRLQPPEEGGRWVTTDSSVWHLFCGAHLQHILQTRNFHDYSSLLIATLVSSFLPFGLPRGLFPSGTGQWKILCGTEIVVDCKLIIRGV